ncbi:hypothetical protein [Zooshikella sp. RANM57]|uniref:hypothetical protein n=1 Tax=Zooshikella sp. RANM57 TaxID=3425863 RepID=UPI003D6E0FD6
MAKEVTLNMALDELKAVIESIEHVDSGLATATEKGNISAEEIRIIKEALVEIIAPIHKAAEALNTFRSRTGPALH